MSLLIDGYNLVFSSTLELRGDSGTALQRLRTGLIDFLARNMDRTVYPTITVVFDASQAPPGLPAHYEQRGIAIHFARDHASADDLLEEIIAAHHSPSRLTVVSSDHRVQRAAKRRRATAIDSEVWIRQQTWLIQLPTKRTDAKPVAPSTPGEVKDWLTFFGDISIAELEAPPAPKKRAKAPAKRRSAELPGPCAPLPAEKSLPRIKKPKRAPSSKEHPDFGLANPFPPGYGNDVAGDL